MLSQPLCWPEGVEIDIMEFKGQETQAVYPMKEEKERGSARTMTFFDLIRDTEVFTTGHAVGAIKYLGQFTTRQRLSVTISMYLL
jgi:hypothetical protein